MHNKLSIVVPVYNVQQYIERCLESIKNQTYMNFEVILVDDGSTDQSAEICQAYVKADKRFKYYKKENGGLADARNYGLKYVSGDYIGFVDSDDYIEKEMFHKLMKVAIDYEADVVASKHKVCDNQYLYSLRDTNRVQVMSGYEMLNEHINLGVSEYYITNSVWDRIYRAELLNGIEFEKGKNYEDIVFTTLVFLKARRCVYFDYSGYIYVQRDGSIMRSGDITRELKDLPYQLKKRISILKSYGMIDCLQKCSYDFCEYCITQKMYLNRNKNRINDAKRYNDILHEEIKENKKSAISYAFKQKKYIKFFTMNSVCYLWWLYYVLRRFVEVNIVDEKEDYSQDTGWIRESNVSICNGTSSESEI